MLTTITQAGDTLGAFSGEHPVRAVTGGADRCPRRSCAA
jgi:hypothetical protein